MLGQGDLYTDPQTGVTFTGDSDAYYKASEALVQINQLISALTQLESQQSQSIAAWQAVENQGGYIPTTDTGESVQMLFIVQHAQTLTDLDEAATHKGNLQSFVDQYRSQVLGSGMAGLGFLPLVIGLLGVIAAAIYWLASARVRLAQSQADLRRYVAQSVSEGTMDQATASQILNTPAPGVEGGGYLSSIFGGVSSGLGMLAVYGLAAVFLFSRAGSKGGK